MLTQFIAAAALTSAALPIIGKADQPTDAAAVQHVVKSFADAWNKGDMAAWAALFDEDADFVVITGKRLVGRPEVASYHAELNSKLYRGSTLTWMPSDIRFLRPDVALVHVSTEISFHGGQDRRTSLALVILDKHKGVWKIASVQNTLTGGAPLTAPK